jgi:uncharacterized protein YkwD
MSKKVAFAIIVAALSLSPIIAVYAQNEVPRARRVSEPLIHRDEARIFALVNRRRESDRRPSLRWDDEIAAVARQYSERMAKESFFDHFDPEGHSAVDRASNVRGWRSIGENLFVCEDIDDLPAFALDGWLDSPTHRTTMLDVQWTSTGVGVARASNGDLYVTQLFTRN